MLRTLILGLLCISAHQHLFCRASSQYPQCYHESRGVTPSPNCESMFTEVCVDTPEMKEVLMGDSTIVSCPQIVQTPTFSIRKVSCNSDVIEPITSDSTGYQINGRDLTILNASREDEGAYYCSENNLLISCVYVSGLARFRTCDPNTPVAFGYVSDSISRMNSCYETLNVTEGQVTLDTRLMFSEGSCCGCTENVQRLVVKFDRFNAEVAFVCNEAGFCNNLAGTNNVALLQQSNNGAFDFMLSVNLNASDSVQEIYIEIEVIIPQSSSRRKFWKVFEITVNPDFTTPAPTTFPPTTSSTSITSTAAMTTSPYTTGETDTSGPSGTGNPIGLGDDGPSGSVVGPAVGAVVAIIVLAGVIIFMVAVLLSRRHRTELMVKPNSENVLHESVDIVKLPPTTCTGRGEVHIYRESVYNFDANQHQLELHLESKVCAKV